VKKGYKWLKQVEPRLTVIDKSLNAGSIYHVTKDWTKKFGDYVEIDENRTTYTLKNPESF